MKSEPTRLGRMSLSFAGIPLRCDYVFPIFRFSKMATMSTTMTTAKKSNNDKNRPWNPFI